MVQPAPDLPGERSLLLQTTRDRHEAILRSLSEGVVLFDGAGHVLTANPAAVAMFRFSERELAGTDPFAPRWTALLSEDGSTLPAEEAPPALCLRTGRAERGQTIGVIEGAGEARWISVDSLPLIPPGQLEPSAVICTMTDVTERRQAGAALRDSELHFRLLADNGTDAVTLAGPDGRYTYVSRAAPRVFGQAAEALLGCRHSDFVHPEDADRLDAALDVLAKGGDHVVVTSRFRRDDGSYAWIETAATQLRDAAGSPMGVQGCSRDVSERKQLENELAQAQARFFLAFSHSVTGMALITLSGRFLDVNEAYAGIVGRTPFELLNMTSEAITHPVDRSRDAEHRQLLLDGGISTCESEQRYLHSSGSTVWVQISYSLLRDGGGAPLYVIATAADITARKQAESELTRLALHDGLTGLPNRVLLLDRIEQALRRSERSGEILALLFLDLDHFKVVNDSLGHAAGDLILGQIGARVYSAVRPADTVARIGGDEFCVLCESLPDQDEAVAIAARISAALRTPFHVLGRDVVATASIGVATVDGLNPMNGEGLMGNADAAMYHAKAMGRARAEVYDYSLREHAMRRLDIEQDLRLALKRDELFVTYQPQFSLPDQRIQGVEALVRWDHPTRGVVLPSEFIGIAEDTGLIIPLGALVLESACEQAQRWRRDYPDSALDVAVNLSARQLLTGTFVDIVADLIGRYELQPGQISLEITESELMEIRGAAARELSQLRDIGIRIGIDDFGTGYCSLTYLTSMPVSFLKVDRSFVSGIGHNTQDDAVVGAVINLAHSLDLTAIGEGAETAGQLNRLQELGCDAVQGFHLGRPLLAPEITALLSAREA